MINSFVIAGWIYALDYEHNVQNIYFLLDHGPLSKIIHLVYSVNQHGQLNNIEGFGLCQMSETEKHSARWALKGS